MTTEQAPRELPPLPEMGATFLDDWGPEVKVGFTADQMRDYALAALVASQAQPAAEPALWQWRFYDQTGEPAWTPWEEVKPRNVYTDTVEDKVRELQTYIAQGYKYEVRALYAIVQQPAEPNAKINRFLEMTRRWVERDGGDTDAALAWMYGTAEPRQDSVHSVESSSPPATKRGYMGSTVDGGIDDH